jgi:orotate phosphoribosyltransferase
VLVVDDVITAGTAIRESLELIRAHGATAAGVLLALDRQERGQGERSAVQELEAEFGLPVAAIARLSDLLQLADDVPELRVHYDALRAYRSRYGVD